MIEPDVNVLDFGEYREWLMGIAAGPAAYGLSEVVLSGFLRIVTSRASASLIYDPALALEFVEALRSRPNCVKVRPGPRQWEIFGAFCRETGARGKLIPDGTTRQRRSSTATSGLATMPISAGSRACAGEDRSTDRRRLAHRLDQRRLPFKDRT